MEECGWIGAAPVLSGSAPKNTLGSGSGSVTISGLNFGVYSFTPTSSHSGDILCGTTSWTSGTAVACSPMAFTPQASAVQARVTVSAVVGTQLAAGFTFDGADLGSESMWRFGVRLPMDGAETVHAMRAEAMIGAVNKQMIGMCD